MGGVFFRNVHSIMERVLCACAVVCFALWFGSTTIPEKHVGIPYRFNAIVKDRRDSLPGLVFHIPIIERYENAQHTSQTDETYEIEAYSLDKLRLVYPIVQIVNSFENPSYVRDVIRRFGSNYDQTLIFDTINHTIAELTSQFTAEECQITKFKDFNEIVENRLVESLTQRHVKGLLIEAVRVKQPRIPESIQHKHLEREKERAAIAVANQSRIVRMIEAETEKEEAKIKALLKKEVALIEAEQHRAVQQVELRMLEDVAASEIGRLLNLSEANASVTMQAANATAGANRLVLSPEFLRLEEINSWKHSTKTVVYSAAEPLSFPLSPLIAGDNTEARQ